MAVAHPRNYFHVVSQNEGGEKHLNTVVRYISEDIIAFWETLGKSRSNDKHVCDEESVPSKYKLHHCSVSQYGPYLSDLPGERSLS